MSKQGFSFNKLFQDSKKVLLSPKEYFSNMDMSGGIGEAVVKALIYGAIAGVFALLWSLFNLTGGIGLFGGSVGILALIWSVIAAVIGVFIGGLIILIIASICKGNNEFEPAIQVAAALMVIMPISAFFGFLGGVRVLSAIIGLAINLYALYLLYIAVTQALKGEDKAAKVVSYVLGGLLILFFIIGLGARSAVRNAGFSEKQVNKALKEYQKAVDEAAKELEEEAKAIEEE
ncbi:MAG: YIP1 family protein [Bacteroidetes bacterium]|nr:YIP1 family protein [Bacteroidota bacterium]